MDKSIGSPTLGGPGHQAVSSLGPAELRTSTLFGVPTDTIGKNKKKFSHKQKRKGGAFKPAPQIDRTRNLNVFGPVQSGRTNYNVNNGPSKIKIGNTKKTNYNVINQIVSPSNNILSYYHPYDSNYFYNNDTDEEDDGNNSYMSRKAFPRPKENRFVDGKRYNEVRYPPDMDYNNPDFANYNPINQGSDYVDDCVEHCDDYGQQVDFPSDDDELRNMNGASGPPEDGLELDEKRKNKKVGKNGLKKKKKKKASDEQKKLKKILLDLASKATNDPITGEEGIPILKFNKDTGKYEAVEVDPSTKAYKDKLQAALNALSAKKLPVDKLKRVLEDEESVPDDSKIDPDLSRVEDGPAETVEEQMVPHIVSDYKDNIVDDKENDGEGAENLKSGVPPPDQENHGSTGTYIVTPPNDETDLLKQIRETLNDNLNKINDLLQFKPEFLSQLLDVDADDLTPLENEFKRFILCKADDRFCNHDLSHFRQTPDGRYDTVSGTDHNIYQRHLNNDNDDHSISYNRRHHDRDYDQEVVSYYSNDKETPIGASISGGDDYTRLQAGINNYHYIHSEGGASNGTPSRNQAREYAEQSSYLDRNTIPNLTNYGPRSQDTRPSAQQRRRRDHLYDYLSSDNSRFDSGEGASNVEYQDVAYGEPDLYTVGTLKPRKEQLRPTTANSSPMSVVQAQANVFSDPLLMTPRNIGRGRSQMTSATAAAQSF